MGGETLAVFLAPGPGIADAQRQPILEIEEFGLAREGEGFLDRVGDQQDVPAGAAAGEGGDAAGQRIRRGNKSGLDRYLDRIEILSP